MPEAHRLSHMLAIGGSAASEAESEIQKAIESNDRLEDAAASIDPPMSLRTLLRMTKKYPRLRRFYDSVKERE